MTKAETAYRTIAEVSDLLQVQPSVLRFWETQFRQIKPLKRMGRRYYTAEEVVLLARIRDLLYQDGFTIKGVQKKLKEKTNLESQSEAPTETLGLNRSVANQFIQDLTTLRDSLKPYID